MQTSSKTTIDTRMTINRFQSVAELLLTSPNMGGAGLVGGGGGGGLVGGRIGEVVEEIGRSNSLSILVMDPFYKM